MHLRKAQDPNASGSQPADLPYQQSTSLDPSSGKQDQEVQDLCREILMVRIAKEPEGDPMERLNLDDYNSDDFDEYLSDNMETTPPTITEAQATTNEDLPAPPPPPAVTVTIQLDEQNPADDLYEHRRQLNQKRACRRQRLANTLQEQQGDNYDYSNCDLRNVINKTLLCKCFMHPKSSQTIFECNSLRKALGAPLLKETLPII